MTETTIAAAAAPFGRDMGACLHTIERLIGEARATPGRRPERPGILSDEISEPVPAGQAGCEAQAALALT